MQEQKKDQNATEKDSFVTPDEKKEDRSADFGDAGQFAPGGYYNQRGATQPDRIDLDEELAPRRNT